MGGALFLDSEGPGSYRLRLMAEHDPFNQGRIMSGRLIDKELNFIFTVWGYRPAPPQVVDFCYRHWRSQQRKNVELRNRRVNLQWNG